MSKTPKTRRRNVELRRRCANRLLLEQLETRSLYHAGPMLEGPMPSDHRMPEATQDDRPHVVWMRIDEHHPFASVSNSDSSDYRSENVITANQVPEADHFDLSPGGARPFVQAEDRYPDFEHRGHHAPSKPEGEGFSLDLIDRGGPSGMTGVPTAPAGHGFDPNDVPKVNQAPTVIPVSTSNPNADRPTTADPRTASSLSDRPTNSNVGSIGSRPGNGFDFGPTLPTLRTGVDGGPMTPVSPTSVTDTKIGRSFTESSSSNSLLSNAAPRLDSSSLSGPVGELRTNLANNSSSASPLATGRTNLDAAVRTSSTAMAPINSSVASTTGSTAQFVKELLLLSELRSIRGEQGRTDESLSSMSRRVTGETLESSRVSSTESRSAESDARLSTSFERKSAAATKRLSPSQRGDTEVVTASYEVERSVDERFVDVTPGTDFDRFAWAASVDNVLSESSYEVLSPASAEGVLRSFQLSVARAEWEDAESSSNALICEDGETSGVLSAVQSSDTDQVAAGATKQAYLSVGVLAAGLLFTRRKRTQRDKKRAELDKSCD
ncbi:MAG: hypothetical protein U0892_15650 [Pirellulales bacterium]